MVKADNTNRSINSFSYSTRGDSITVLSFICIYIGLRINVCLVNKTQVTKETIGVFSNLA